VARRWSSQVLAIFSPSPPHPPEIYSTLLSFLAKAILQQAETEVTASKHAARALAVREPGPCLRSTSPSTTNITIHHALIVTTTNGATTTNEWMGG
jgi:hypothetical protein